MEVKDLEIKELKESLQRARNQRDQYGTAYKGASKYIKELEKKIELLNVHNLMHMKQKVELQDRILELETNDYLHKLDKQHLLKW